MSAAVPLSVPVTPLVAAAAFFKADPLLPVCTVDALLVVAALVALAPLPELLGFFVADAVA